MSHRLARSAPRQVWGLDPTAIHDRYWASMGIDVVRRGQPTPTRQAACFLLLEPGQLVLFDPPRMPRRCRLLRVGVVDPRSRRYTERVTTDTAGRMTGFTRSYRPSRQRRSAFFMTGDRRLAARWRSAPSHHQGRCTVRVAAGIDGERRVRRRGRITRISETHRVKRLMNLLVKRWVSPHTVLPALVAVRPRVWAHPSASIDPKARLVGPLWIGAGVTLGADAIAIGPAVMPDSVVTPVPTRVRALSESRRRRTSTRRKSHGPRTKRLFDFVAGTTALILAAPLFPIIMAAIWLEDRRPFFFSQRRQARGGRPFACYKFRTMRSNAELCKHDIAELNVCDGPHFHIENDPRLLRVGRLLRRFHLDELPQLVNVVRGDMSLIGPRPSPDEENRYCPAWREARLSVRPGLTGLWQIRRTRAPHADFQEWIRHDLDYVSRQSWRLDLMIAAKTTWQITARLAPGRGARPRMAPPAEAVRTREAA